MAGAGAKLFTSGSVLTAAQVNTFLMDQTIMAFADVTARDAAFGGAGEPTLAEGMFAYTSDTNTLWYYSGTEWVTVLGSQIGQLPLMNRNVIINGSMAIYQRAATVTGIASVSAYRTADRWYFDNSGAGTYTQSIETDAPTGSGLRTSVKNLITTANASPAAGAFAFMQQRIEGQNIQRFDKGTSAAKKFALSFWVKSSNTGTFIAELVDNTNTRSVSAAYTISAANTWELKKIIFPADQTGQFANNATAGLFVNLWFTAGANFTSNALQTTWNAVNTSARANGQTNICTVLGNYHQFTGVQLEVGDYATPFEFEPVDATLMKCYRYYQSIVPYTGSTDGALFIGSYLSATTFRGFYKCTVTLRGTPTLVNTFVSNQFAASNAADDIMSTFDLINPNTVGVILSNNTEASGTLNAPAIVRSIVANGILALNAEL